jgi:hypothetical protein
VIRAVQKDVRKIETTPYHLSPPWRKNPITNKSTNPYAQVSSDSTQKQQILDKKFNDHIKIYTDGSKKGKKVGCAVITSERKFRKYGLQC